MRPLFRGFILDALQAGRTTKLDAALGPLSVLGENIVSNKGNLCGSSDEFVFSRAGPGRYKREDRSAVWRSHCNPAFTGLKPSIVDEIESKLIEIESQASILI